MRTQTPEAAAAVAAAFGSSAHALVKDTQRHSFALPLISPPHEPALRTSLLGCQKVDADPAGLTTTELQEESAEATVHGTSAVHGPPRHARKTPGETARQFARSVTEAAAWHRTSTHSSAVLAPEGGKGGETAENGGESKWSARREAEAEIHVTPGEPTWQDPFADELVMKAVGQQGGNSVRALMHRKCTEERLQKEVGGDRASRVSSSSMRRRRWGRSRVFIVPECSVVGMTARQTESHMCVGALFLLRARWRQSTLSLNRKPAWLHGCMRAGICTGDV